MLKFLVYTNFVQNQRNRLHYKPALFLSIEFYHYDHTMIYFKFDYRLVTMDKADK